jgi:hypothetical protein
MRIAWLDEKASQLKQVDGHFGRLLPPCYATEYSRASATIAVALVAADSPSLCLIIIIIIVNNIESPNK